MVLFVFMNLSHGVCCDCRYCCGEKASTITRLPLPLSKKFIHIIMSVLYFWIVPSNCCRWRCTFAEIEFHRSVCCAPSDLLWTKLLGFANTCTRSKWKMLVLAPGPRKTIWLRCWNWRIAKIKSIRRKRNDIFMHQSVEIRRIHRRLLLSLCSLIDRGKIEGKTRKWTPKKNTEWANEKSPVSCSILAESSQTEV